MLMLQPYEWFRTGKFCGRAHFIIFLSGLHTYNIIALCEMNVLSHGLAIDVYEC